MTYQVLARKYRPQLFEDVVAQQHITRTLKNALKRDRIASGYLFSGPRGTGKTTVARILAKGINCVNGPTEHPCGECDPCREIASGSSLDVLEIDAASNTGVDDIRTLRENVRYLPTGGKRRVYIIDEVHRLSGSAFDALLKTLEEPPPHVTFMFATTEPLKVPETILSRTQRYDFRRVSVKDLSAHLKTIAKKEEFNIDESALKLLARKADGSVRDSLSLLDQVVAFSGEKITEEDIINALGLVDSQLLFDFVEAVASRDSRKALLLVRQLIEAGVDVADFVSELLEHLRVLMVMHISEDADNLLSLSQSEMEQYGEQRNHFDTGDILRLMKIAAEINSDLKSGLDHRLLLELGAVKMASLESTVNIEELLRALKTDSPAEKSGDDLFGPDSKKKTDSPVNRRLTVLKSSETQAEIRQNPRINLPQIRARWSDFLNVLRNGSPMLASQLGMVTPTEVNDNLLQVAFPGSAETNLQVVQKRENLQLIHDALRDHYKTNLRLKFVLDKNRSNAEPEESREPGFNPEELLAKSEDLRKLVDRVNGEIIGIKRLK